MLTRTMPHPAKRVSLELDAREGEHQVEANTIDSTKQLQVLLGKPGKAGNGRGRSRSERYPGRRTVLKQHRQWRPFPRLCLCRKFLPNLPKHAWANVGMSAIPLGKRALHLYAQPLGARLPKSLK